MLRNPQHNRHRKLFIPLTLFSCNLSSLCINLSSSWTSFGLLVSVSQLPLLNSQEAAAAGFFFCLEPVSFLRFFTAAEVSACVRRMTFYLLRVCDFFFPPCSKSGAVTDDIKDDVCRLFVAPTLPKHGLALIPTRRPSCRSAPFTSTPLHRQPPRPTQVFILLADVLFCPPSFLYPPPPPPKRG